MSFLEEGKLSEVRLEIDHLLEQFPNHAGVMFLAAQTEEQAEDAVMAYKKLNPKTILTVNMQMML